MPAFSSNVSGKRLSPQRVISVAVPSCEGAGGAREAQKAGARWRRRCALPAETAGRWASCCASGYCAASATMDRGLGVRERYARRRGARWFRASSSPTDQTTALEKITIIRGCQGSRRIGRRDELRRHLARRAERRIVESGEIFLDRTARCIRRQAPGTLDTVAIPRVRVDQTGVDRKAFAAHQPLVDAPLQHRREQPPQQIALAKAAVAGLREGRVIRYTAVETEPAEPSVWCPPRPSSAALQSPTRIESALPDRRNPGLFQHNRPVSVIGRQGRNHIDDRVFDKRAEGGIRPKGECGCAVAWPNEFRGFSRPRARCRT